MMLFTTSNISTSSYMIAVCATVPRRILRRTVQTQNKIVVRKKVGKNAVQLSCTKSQISYQSD
jgi:starvation-inducible outer membrane lipoprotein